MAIYVSYYNMNKPLTDKEIQKIFNNKVNIVSYEDLPNKKRIEDIIYPYNNTVIFYALESPNSGHWLAIKEHNNKIIFFDSFGRTDKQILEDVDEDVKLLTDQDFPYLTNLLRKSNKKVVINKRELQNKNTSTCGRWCSWFLYNIDKYETLNKLLDSHPFTNDTLQNDREIIKLTKYYL